MPRGQSGNNGYMTIGSCDIQELTDWNMDKDYGTQTYNSRSGAGYQKTVVGNKKITGTIGGKFDTDDDIRTNVDTESLVALVLYLDTASFWSGNARISNINMSVNIDSGEPEAWTATFESDGVWAKT